MAEVTPLTLDDYDAIADAVQETERGRWFLAEYARRNRAADTAAVLDALAGLERRLRLQGPASPVVVGLVHEALEQAMRARAASRDEALKQFDALERTLRRAAEELGSPAPERGASVSIEEILLAPASGTPPLLSLAAPPVAETTLVVRADAGEPARVVQNEDPATDQGEPMATPSLAHGEAESEPEPLVALSAASAIEPPPTVVLEAQRRLPERPTPSLAPARPTLLLDSLSAAEKAILFA